MDPVVEGMVRAKQDDLKDRLGMPREEVIDLAMPVLLHGDAAFAGQGVVMETLNLASLARLPHRRNNSHHHQQPDRIHHVTGSRTLNDLFN